MLPLAITRLIIPMFILGIVGFLIPALIWFTLLIRLERFQTVHPVIKILSLCLLGSTVLLLAFYGVENGIITMPLLKEYILFVLPLWLLFSFSQLNMHIISKLLERYTFRSVILEQLGVVILGLLTINFGHYINQWRFVIIGHYLVIKTTWFIFASILERKITGDYPLYKINRLKSKTVVSIDYKLTVMSAIMDRLSAAVNRLINFKWLLCFAILATLLEVYIFSMTGYAIYTFVLNEFPIIYISIFLGTALFMSIIHEWGHLIAVRHFGGNGLYKTKNILLVSSEAVQIPLLLYSPIQRIKIAVFGVLWVNLICLLPLTVLAYTALVSSEVWSNIIIVIPLSMLFYAILGTFFFVSSLWPGGDMNNCVRDAYLILTKSNTIPKSLFNRGTDLEYSVANPDFKFEKDKQYTLPMQLVFRRIDDDKVYMLDNSSFSSFLINDTGFAIAKKLKSEIWDLKHILKEIETEYDIKTKETLQEVEDDVVDFLTYLGQHDMLKKLPSSK